MNLDNIKSLIEKIDIELDAFITLGDENIKKSKVLDELDVKLGEKQTSLDTRENKLEEEKKHLEAGQITLNLKLKDIIEREEKLKDLEKAKTALDKKGDETRLAMEKLDHREIDLSVKEKDFEKRIKAFDFREEAWKKEINEKEKLLEDKEGGLRRLGIELESRKNSMI